MEETELTTEKAIEQICNILKTHRRNIGYAGNKDKDAITYQKISIKSTKPLEKFKIDRDNLTLKLMGKGKSKLKVEGTLR